MNHPPPNQPSLLSMIASGALGCLAGFVILSTVGLVIASIHWLTTTTSHIWSILP